MGVFNPPVDFFGAAFLADVFLAGGFFVGDSFALVFFAEAFLAFDFVAVLRFAGAFLDAFDLRGAFATLTGSSRLNETAP